MQLFAAGNVNGDTTPLPPRPRNDLLISGVVDGAEQSYLVLGTSAGAPSVSPKISQALLPLGNVNGDSFDDLGGLVLEASPTLAEDGSQVHHPVGHVHLGYGANQHRLVCGA